MTIHLKVHAMSNGLAIARGYTGGGTLIIQSKVTDPVRALREVASWLRAHRPEWIVVQ